MDFIDISEVQERIQDEKAFLNIDAFFAGYATQVYGGNDSLELVTYEMISVIEAFDEKRMKPIEKLSDFVDFLLTVARDEFKLSVMKKPSDNQHQGDTPKDMLLNYFQSIQKKIENDKSISKVGLYCIGYFLAEHPAFQTQRVLRILQNAEKNLPKEFNLQRAQKLFSSLQQALKEEEEGTIQNGVQAKQDQKEKVKTEKPVKTGKKDTELEGKTEKAEKNIKKKKQQEEEKPKTDKKAQKKENKNDDQKKKAKKEIKTKKTKKAEVTLERSFGGIPLVDSFVISQPTFPNKPQIQQELHFEEPSPKKPVNNPPPPQRIFEISLQNISLVTSHVIPQARIQHQPPPPLVPHNQGADIFPKRMELESPIAEQNDIVESDHSSVHTSIMNLEQDGKEIEEEEELPLKNSYSGDQQQLSSFRVPEWQFDTPKRHILKEESFQTSQNNFFNFFGLFDRFFCSRRKKPSSNKDMNLPSTPTSQQPFITPFKQEDDFIGITPKGTQTKDYQFGTQMTKCSTAMNDSNEAFVGGRVPCSICLKKVLIQELGPAFQGCGHKYCQDCLETLKTTFQNLVQLHDLPVICPSKGCSKPLCLMDLMDILNDWTLEIYVKYTLENYIDQNQHMRCCPNPDCMYAFPTTIGNNYFKCVKCEKAYCLECCTDWHQGQDCNKKKKPSTKVSKMKSCPNCSVWVQKKLGEKCLQCKSCKERFCFDCGKRRQKDYCSCYGDLNIKPIVPPELFHK